MTYYIIPEPPKTLSAAQELIKSLKDELNEKGNRINQLEYEYSCLLDTYRGAENKLLYEGIA